MIGEVLGRKIRIALRNGLTLVGTGFSGPTLKQTYGKISTTLESMKNGTIVMPKTINREELALHKATKYRFVVDTLRSLGLYDRSCVPEAR